MSKVSFLLIFLPFEPSRFFFFRSIEITHSVLQLATLTGHTYRVLYLAISPDGQVIVRFVLRFFSFAA